MTGENESTLTNFSPVDRYSFVVANDRVDGHPGVLLYETGDQLHLRDHFVPGDVPDVMWRYVARPHPVFGLKRIQIISLFHLTIVNQCTYIRVHFINVL